MLVLVMDVFVIRVLPPLMVADELTRRNTASKPWRGKVGDDE